MKTQVSELADNRVRLDVEVPAADVDHAFDHALHDLSQSVRVPGFRKGRAPKPLVMRQVGRETVVEEALRDHLSGWYSRAVAVAGIDPVDRPTIDWTDQPAEGAPFAFTAEVEVKQPPEVRAYKGLEGVRIPVEVPAEAIDGEIDRLRATVGELRPVDRPAAAGDFVVIDFDGRVGGKTFDGSTGSDYGVELGAGRLVPALEEGITGMRVGEQKDIDFTFGPDEPQDELVGRPVQFHVALKDVKERVLPPLDDELAMSVSEFDTLEELRADIEGRFREAIQADSDRHFRTSVLASLGEQLSTPVPEPLVASRLREMTRRLAGELSARGIELEDYLRLSAQTPEGLIESLRPQAEEAVRRDLALEAVVAAEEVEISDEMVRDWVREQAAETDEDPDEAVERLTGDPGVLTALRTDLGMQKALDVVVENAREISPEQADAKERLWTPEKETAASAAKDTPTIWTPGSGEPVNR